jgi:hypothetical protein
VLAVETGELAWAAARALAMTRDPAAEEPLLRALAEGPRDVRLAAGEPGQLSLAEGEEGRLSLAPPSSSRVPTRAKPGS